ncbi:hypothetical protein RD110_22560 [Rhodoferax koreense]|uniref:Inner membrane protein YgaP-like transmembrane domain-containing protein n=1 Tax=Rhodoferax koreensis TaxID=1842727 RepID=A0A1P8K0V5_9BURK|nr:DUF2892 domain-containing protein [Rhodoferax koreense]APW39644.1 hypothetical protein RD110_22560 [Rhodoferax koreense]
MTHLLAQNLGLLDRLARIGLGVVLIGLAAFGSIGAWGYVGVLPLLTAIAGSCPAYRLFGWSTRADARH